MIDNFLLHKVQGEATHPFKLHLTIWHLISGISKPIQEKTTE